MEKRDPELDALIEKIRSNPRELLTMDIEELERLTKYMRLIKDEIKGGGWKL